MSDQTFSRGNVAYGGTGNATSGPVDPSGYIDRTNRYQLAMNAIARRQGMQQSTPPQQPIATTPTGQSIDLIPHPLNTGQHYPSMAAQFAQPKNPEVYTGAPTTPVATGAKPVASSGVAPTPVTHPSATSIAPVSAPHTITVGTTTPNPATLPSAAVGKPVTTTMANLPSDPKLQAMQDALEREKLLYEGSEGLSLQQKLSNLAAQEMLANEAQPKLEAHGLADFGSRGLGYSSGYLNNLGDLKSALARRIGGYQSEATDAKNNYAMALQRFLNNYIAQQSQIAGSQASWADSNLADTALRSVLGKK